MNLDEKLYLNRSAIVFRAYLRLCKPKVVLLLIVTAWVGMQLANKSQVSISIMFIAIIGIALVASSAAVINHLVDVNIDKKMMRTQNRPLVTGYIAKPQALLFALSMALSGIGLLIVYVNLLTALLTIAGLIGYAFIYTVYLKHKTPQNIVLGGLAGALPPVLGWTSITNAINVEPLLLMLIIFVWTPAHFWALAIDRVEDYKKANVPMLPVIYGIDYTKNWIIFYSFALLIASLLPYIQGMSTELYLICAILLGSWFLYHSIKLKLAPNAHSAIKTFRVSIIYLFLLFFALLVDHFVVYRPSYFF